MKKIKIHSSTKEYKKYSKNNYQIVVGMRQNWNKHKSILIFQRNYKGLQSFILMHEPSAAFKM